MARPVASDTLHLGEHYQRYRFHKGMERLGYQIGIAPKQRPEPRDVLIIWNRHEINDRWAKLYENVGARVIVVENGYIGRDTTGKQLYAMALGHHLGAGTWKEGPEDRWSRLNVPLVDWRRDIPANDRIVVLPQRGIGERGVTMAPGWTKNVVERLKKLTDRPIFVRDHPGKTRTDPLLDLKNAYCAVTWASGAGIKAICYGIPVFYELERWIGAPAAKFGLEELETPFLDDRLPMLKRLAWSQFTSEEILSGEAMAWLLA
jgi:hypothetical protein